MRPTYALGLLVAVAVFTVRQCEANVGANSRVKVNLREKEKQILDKILGPQHYDRRIRPAGINGTDGASVVNINLMFRGFSAISDNKMEISTIITFREEWYDDRLVFDDMQGRMKYLTLTDPSKVWMPDLFFANERQGHFHNIIVPNVYVRIFPTGYVLYSIRLSLTLSCPMNLKLFPLDRQTCSLRMASYGWTTADLIFLWRPDDPVQVAKNLQLPRFALEKFKTDSCNSKTNTGEYSCLKVDLLFRREFSYYMITIYIPCCMLVIVSWVSFWLDANAVPARVSLGVTTLLTMSTQTTGINNSLPPVSYTKAIDVWTGVCLTFGFGALLEFALVNYASRSDAQREKMRKQRKQWEADQRAAMEAMAADGLLDDRNSFAMKPLVPASAEMIFMEDGQQRADGAAKETCCQTWIGAYQWRSKRIDVVSRIIFPLVFAVFNLAYWSTYLSQEDSETT